jgi:hypothetical protein
VVVLPTREGLQLRSEISGGDDPVSEQHTRKPGDPNKRPTLGVVTVRAGNNQYPWQLNLCYPDSGRDGVARELKQGDGDCEEVRGTLAGGREDNVKG